MNHLLYFAFLFCTFYYYDLSFLAGGEQRDRTPKRGSNPRSGKGFTKKIYAVWLHPA